MIFTDHERAQMARHQAELLTHWAMVLLAIEATGGDHAEAHSALCAVIAAHA